MVKAKDSSAQSAHQPSHPHDIAPTPPLTPWQDNPEHILPQPLLLDIANVVSKLTPPPSHLPVFVVLIVGSYIGNYLIVQSDSWQIHSDSDPSWEVVH